MSSWDEIKADGIKLVALLALLLVVFLILTVVRACKSVL